MSDRPARSAALHFAPAPLTAAHEALRREVRRFLETEVPEGHRPGLGMSSGHAPEFSRKLAERGWVGMALPRRYGGQGRSALDRCVVTEEPLAAGAPVAAHWTADRQTGPSILRFGSDEQRARFLPAIARGECWFSLGMSEPDSGSDLASVRTTAVPVRGGWRLNGTKVWTTYAHLNHYVVVLCRTGSSEKDRHRNLSQLIVDLHSPGVRVSTIPLLDGTHDFAEVAMTDVFVADADVLGVVGRGWEQVTSELALERSGPDRYLSTWRVFEEWLRAHPSVAGDRALEAIGQLASRFWAIRQMSLAIAAAVDAGQDPAVHAALVKDIGTTFEQEVVEVIRRLVPGEVSLDDGGVFEQLLARAVLNAPSFTIRGGTSEVLRTVAARGLAVAS